MPNKDKYVPTSVPDYVFEYLFLYISKHFPFSGLVAVICGHFVPPTIIYLFISDRKSVKNSKKYRQIRQQFSASEAFKNSEKKNPLNRYTTYLLPSPAFHKKNTLYLA